MRGVFYCRFGKIPSYMGLVAYKVEVGMPTATIVDKRNRKTTFQVISVEKMFDDVEIEIEDFNKLQCLFPLLFDSLSEIMKATCVFYKLFKK